MVGLAAFYACSDKETPQPVEDTARVDALRTELRSLQEEVLGKQAEYSSDSLTKKELEAEIAALNEMYAKVVDYSVTVTDLQGNILPDAEVKLTQGGKVVSATTNSGGIATFEALHGGIISASVKLNGFATLTYSADIRDYNTPDSYSGASHVSLIPTGGTPASEKGMFTINLDLYANYTTVDDTLGGPDAWGSESDITKALPYGPDGGTTSYSKVTDKTVSVTLVEGYVYADNDYFFTQSGVGEVVNVANENVTIKYSAATNGTYAIKVPARTSSSDLYYTIVYDEFTAKFTDYVPNGVNGGVHIDPPFSETIEKTQIYRIDADDYEYSALPGTILNWKRFYYYDNN